MAPRRLFRPVASDSIKPTTTIFNFVTVTRTTVRWVEQSSTLRRVASPVQNPSPYQPTPTPSVESEGTFPQEQTTLTNSQPGTQSVASPTPSPTSSIKPTTFSIQTDASLPAKDFYSLTRPSHPHTLFDRHGVTPTDVLSSPRADCTPYAPLSSMEGGEFELPDIPTSVQFVLFACLGLGLLWSILVWLINSPRTPHRDKSHTQKEDTRTWWTRVWGLKRSRQRAKNIPNNSSRYAPLRSASSTDTASSTQGVPTASSTSLSPASAAASIRLRNLTPATKGREPLSPSVPPWATPPLTSSLRDPFQSPTSSPANPFLRPTLDPRSSAEYLAAHATFFSHPPSPAASGAQLSPYPSRSASPLSDLDALEAQTDVEPRRSRALQMAEGVERTRAMVWTGGWLDAVEGGVNRAVEKFVRWTGEDGEGVVLPVER